MILGLSVFLAVFSLLNLFKAPAIIFWIPEILTTEWGHFFALGCVLLFFFSGRAAHHRRVCRLLALASAVLFLTPVLRASFIARRLPLDLEKAFGRTSPRSAPDAPARQAPVNSADLFRGIRSPSIRITSLMYPSSTGEPLGLDLYRPAHPAGIIPCIVVIHGGSWDKGSNAEFQDLNRYLAARGYAVAAINYHLAPRWPFPVAREDALAAVRYLKDRAEALQINPARFVVLGRSAGGQIALSAACAGEDPSIRGVIVFYTPNDLVWGYAHPTNPLIMNSCKVIERYLGGPPTRMPAQYEKASPLRFVNARTPPTLMIHGDHDELVSPLHEERLSRRMAEFHRPFYYLRFPWATHGCDANFSGPCGQLSTYAVERFLASVLPFAVTLRRD